MGAEDFFAALGGSSDEVPGEYGQEGTRQDRILKLGHTHLQVLLGGRCPRDRGRQDRYG